MEFSDWANIVKREAKKFGRKISDEKAEDFVDQMAELLFDFLEDRSVHILDMVDKKYFQTEIAQLFEDNELESEEEQELFWEE